MLSDEIKSALFGRRNLKAKAYGERVKFRCLRHEDSDPSAWMAGGAWGCFACGFEESITTLAAELGIVTTGDSGLTLAAYADQKGLSVERLRAWGVDDADVDGRSVVRIPYYGDDGTELRARFRSRTGKWWEGKNRPIYLYGVDHLVDAKPGDAVVVVEGESDCHALWSDGFLAVGVPGATTWRSEWKGFLADLDVYVWEEPDQAGAQMVAKVTADLPHARIIQANGAKDPAEMRQREGSDFAAKFRGMMAEAKAVNGSGTPTAFDVLLAPRLARLLEEKLKPIDSVPTPFPSWSVVCGDEGGRHGLARGWHVICAARTGAGKSILALQVAAHAMRCGERVCLISLEMHQRQVETRLLAIVSGEEIHRLEMGADFSVDAYKRAAASVERIHEDTGGMFWTNRELIHNVEDVTRAMRYNHEVHGCRFFLTDYLQLAGNANDPESITEVSHRVRHMAAELQVVSVGLSQFNRITSASHDRPSPQGLMGGSALENDADQVILIDHSKVELYRKPLPTGQVSEGWNSALLVAKNRHGAPAEIPFQFNKRTLQMRELMPDE